MARLPKPEKKSRKNSAEDSTPAPIADALDSLEPSGEEVIESKVAYDPNAIPADSVAHPDNQTEPLELGVSSDGPFLAPAGEQAPADEQAPETSKRKRKPREVTPIRLAGVAETRIKRLRESSKQRIEALKHALEVEESELDGAIARVLASYPSAVQGVLRALGVIESSYPALEYAEQAAEPEKNEEASDELPF